MTDIEFICDANSDVGFGHLSRCLKLATILCAGRQISTTFCGNYSEPARHTIQRMMPASSIVSQGSARSRAIVYDTMFDTEDPDSVDQFRVDSAASRTSNLFFLVSGRRAPRLPENATCIGYSPGGPESVPPRVYWSLKYAPVSIADLPETWPERQSGNAFVALGGARSEIGLRKVMSALSMLRQVKVVDVLISPVSPFVPQASWLRVDQQLNVHSAVPSVVAFLLRAEVVIASYGHLGYEALACGAPLCLVGQKTFQVDYAEYLAKRGLCVAGGLLADATMQTLSSAIFETLSFGKRLAANAKRSIDSRGLDRIAALIADRLRSS